jgi:acyl-CoA dehydrogenase
MDFSESAELTAIRENVRKVAALFPPAYWREHDTTETFPSEYWEAVGRNGWLNALVPEAYGGSGLGTLEMAVIIEELVAGGAGGTGGIVLMANMCFGTISVLRYGTEEQKRKYLPMMGDGKSIIALAFTEPDAGSDALDARTLATRDGDGWRLSGSKVFITSIQRADAALILARSRPRGEGGRRSDGFSTFMLDHPAAAAGVKITPLEKLGLNALQTNQVFFDDVRLEPQALLGQEHAGWHQIFAVLNHERIATAAIAVGLGNLAIEAAVRYANERRLFGRPIGANQSLSFPLAEAKVELEAARLLNHKAAWLYDHGRPCANEVNMAKYLATEACWKACDWAVQVHGGYGYIKDYHVERYFREARLIRIAPITSQMALNHITQNVLGLPRSY